MQRWQESPVVTRAARVAVALACAAIGAGVARLFGLRGDRFVGMSAAWATLALALALEPDPRGPRWRALAAAAAAALLGAAFALWTATRGGPPPWHALQADAPSLGLLAACAAWVDLPLRSTLVVGAALLPGPLLLLLARAHSRQLEWQAGAAGLGVLLAGLALVPGRLRPLWAFALLLVVSGLPLACGTYLLERRLVGPAALADPRPTPRTSALLALAALAGLAWSIGAGVVGPRLLELKPEPDYPDMSAVLEDVRARQARHAARTGAPARELGALEGVSPAVAGGYTQGHVLRYARLDDTRWVLTADPVPGRMAWPSLRVRGPDGPIERSGHGAYFSLDAE